MFPPEGVEPEKLRETFVANLKFAAPRLQEAGVKLLIEPINTRDIPGFYLTHTSKARSDHRGGGLRQPGPAVRRVPHADHGGRPGPYDRGQPWTWIEHFQIADTPGRNEPGTGEINYPFLFDFIDRTGYEGWIGCEYKPTGTTESGLDWVRPYLDSL